MPSLIAVGRIGKSVGLKGEVKIIPLTADLQRFDALERVLLGTDETSVREYAIARVRFTAGTVIISFQDVATRTEADDLRGNYLFIRPDQSITPPEGSYFVHDIVGMTVVTEEGVAVGSVKDVQELPAHDLWVVRTSGGDVLIPAVREIIKTVDITTRTIVIAPPEGMID